MKLVRALVVLAAVLAGTARAQEAAPPLQEDPRAPRFAEVERGFFTGFEAGWLHLFDSPTADRARHPFAGESGGAAGGFMMGAHVGREVTDRVAVALFASGANPQASASYGAFNLVAMGLDVRTAGDDGAKRAARDRVQLAKEGLGERGDAWWDLEVPQRLARAEDRLAQLERLAPSGPAPS